ncbi:Gfo/Idh/MocA family oxidoreductase [Pacificibacter sp. AS14]|uniref:Gfo/Idh/MocA family protein n=1 Tax=Alphaproteobacteria TaxID=28211 RepID=UPI003175E129
MKVAVSGVGLRSIKVLKYMKKAMPEIEYVGYFDPQPCLHSELESDRDIPQFDSIETMLAESKPDLFFVGSPNHVHLDQIRMGLDAGVRVFAEKPVVSTLEQTWKIAELLKEYGSDQILVGLVLRYAPQMVDLRKALEAGQLGDVVSLEANEHIEPAHGAFFMRDWRRFVHYSGGFMVEKCVHDLDLYNMITRSRPRKVASFGGRRSFLCENAPANNSDMEILHLKKSRWESNDDPFNAEADIIDHQTALISYENGVSMTFHTNLNIPDQHRRFLVAGTKGTAEGDFQRGVMRVTASPSGKCLLDKDYSKGPDGLTDHYGADAKMGRDLAAYLRKETDHLPVSVVDALEAGICAMALDQARESGDMLDLTELWQRFDSYKLRSSAVT